MGTRSVQAFSREREELNALVMRHAGLTMKRFWSLDSQAYREGALPRETKELLGLVASLVLRCDDCVTYHLVRCGEEGVSDQELEEALAIGLIVGGSITIPHVRRAFKTWEAIVRSRAAGEATASSQEPRRRARAPRRPPFASLLTSATRILRRAEVSRDARLAELCAFLHRKVPYYNWVGFYIVDPARKRELVLGPFKGEPTAHTRIPFGRGICGQAAETKRTFLVQDVNKETNYLACSVKVKSEIVVPIIRRGSVRAELDIDSHTPAAFGDDDRRFLESVCAIAADIF